jgi:hypothetical protein
MPRCRGEGGSLRSKRYRGFGQRVGGQVVIFWADSAQSAALSPKPGASPAVPIEDWENHAVVKPYRLLLRITVMILLAGEAAAQTLARGRHAPPSSATCMKTCKSAASPPRLPASVKSAARRCASTLRAYSAAELKWVKYV